MTSSFWCRDSVNSPLPTPSGITRCSGGTGGHQRIHLSHVTIRSYWIANVAVPTDAWFRAALSHRVRNGVHQWDRLPQKPKGWWTTGTVSVLLQGRWRTANEGASQMTGSNLGMETPYLAAESLAFLDWKSPLLCMVGQFIILYLILIMSGSSFLCSRWHRDVGTKTRACCRKVNGCKNWTDHGVKLTITHFCESRLLFYSWMISHRFLPGMWYGSSTWMNIA